MPIHLPLVIAATAALLSLSGCTQYRYVQPDSAEGRQCVAKLDGDVAQCEQRASKQLEADTGIYDAMMASYQSCLHNSSRDAPQGQVCGPAPVDPRTEQARSCRQGYKLSFTGCGGRIEEVPRE